MAFIPTLIKLEQVLAPDRNKWYKVRPENFLFTSVHLAPKMLYAICSYPWSKHSVSDTHVQSMTQPYSSSTAAAFSQHRQNSSSCSRGQTPRCILSLSLIYPRVQRQQQRRRLRAFCSLQNTITFITFHTFFIIQELKLIRLLVNSTFHNVSRRTTIHN